MLRKVVVGQRPLGAYRQLVPEHIIDELYEAARPLRGARILQLNATAYGGGVSELLRSGVPLLNDLGLNVEWSVIHGETEFFKATKAIHNGLQGAPEPLSDDELAAYGAATAENAQALDGDYDFVVVHDPQPAAILDGTGRRGARWVWRCHIDTSEPNPQVWAFLRPFLAAYDAAIFTMAQFVPTDFPLDRVAIIAPAIDPLSPKNMPLDTETARQILGWIGIHRDIPMVTQVSRFDPWKDPLGVVRAYRMAREAIPSLQLALIGSMALDDPESWEIYQQVTEDVGSDPLIHVHTNLTGIGNLEVNAFQRMSDVVVQKSIREGFGLVVSESLWKGTPVVAGRAGGIPMQMPPGIGGHLVDSVESCAARLVDLLRDPEASHELGALGREHVREHYLLPRLLAEELRLLASIA